VEKRPYALFHYVRQRISRRYLIITTTTIVIVFALLYFWVARQQRHLIMAQVEKQAVILHKQLTLTRQWVSTHNYILVAGDQRDETSDFLINPTVHDQTGRVYTKITPAMLTRHLSEFARKDSLYHFNLTNIDGLNPANQPDAFEAGAIRRFRQGRMDGVSRIEDSGDEVMFRYAAPLYITQSCLACHQQQGFQVGDIGGCISVLIPFERTRAAIVRNNLSLLAGMGGLTLAVIMMLFWFSRATFFKPIHEISQSTRRLKSFTDADLKSSSVDELQEFADVCYLVDEKLKNQHQELALRISEATRDLSKTNSELSAANDSLVKLNRAKTDFLSDISHELRTPLASIKGAVDLMERKGTCRNEAAYLKIIRDNTAVLIRTIVDFIDYAKIEAVRLELEKRCQTLGEIVAEVVGSQQASLEKKGLMLEVRQARDPQIELDRHRIYQVLSNLLSNATRFAPAGSTISIEIKTDERGAQVAIEDAGPGIAPAYHEAIFDKFFQVANAEQRLAQRSGSAGIGLAICKGIVEAHGGRIWVESAPEQGSRFIFHLPALALCDNVA
jgi:signal transduction histidine kinase